MQALIHRLEYIGLRILAALIHVAPWGLVRAMARGCAWLAWLLDRRERKARAAENLRRAFPQMSPREANRTVRRVYRHLAECLFDLLKLAKLARQGDGARYFEAIGFEKLEDAARQTGVVFATGHFGHWEVLGTAASLLGYPVWTIGRNFDNALIDEYVRRVRGVTGQRMLPRHGATLQMFRSVREGENVGILIDQDARRHGIFVDFFGRPASTTDMAGRLCVRTGAPAAFVYAQRIPGQNRFRIVCADVIHPDPDAPPESEVRRITQRLTKDLEDVVRQAPQQWLWLHRRWKTWPGKYRKHAAPAREEERPESERNVSPRE